MLISLIIILVQSGFGSASGAESVCRTLTSKQSGSLQSPSFPTRYPDNIQCEYFIRPVLSADNQLQLVPVTFEVESAFDFLEVREMGPHGVYIGRFTGKNIPVLYSKSFWLRFTSDYSNSGRGFNFTWSVTNVGIRLVNGTQSSEGRVEVYHSGKWGTICDDGWGKTEADVVCKMLGYPQTSGLAFSNSIFGKGQDPIWLDNLGCYGNETTLLDCRSTVWGEHNCNHGEDSGVRCLDAFAASKHVASKRRSFPKGCGGWFTSALGSAMSPQFPLYPNYAHCEYTVVPDMSDVGTTQLHFTSFDLEEGSDFLEIREQSADGPFLGRFSGSRMPPLFNAKSFWLKFTSDASRGRRGFLAKWETAEDGAARLRNGTWYGEGRIEILRNGVWGTVCDDYWEDPDAVVVCKMLGFAGPGASAVQGGAFGPGTGYILMDDVACHGNESDIISCEFPGWATHNCNHNEDAGVRCAGETVDSTAGTRVKLNSTTKELLRKAVNLSCGSMTLTATVNMSVIKSIYPAIEQNNQFLTLSVPECVGAVDGNMVTFTTNITDCGMTSTETNDAIVYHNKIVSRINETGQSGIFRTTGTIAMPIECSLSKEVSIIGRIDSYREETELITIKGYGNFSASLDFYKDPNYSRMVYDYPLYVELGQNLYVEAVLLTKDKNLKVALTDCAAVSTLNHTTNSTDNTYELITNRCPVDPTTKILDSEKMERARFTFTTFEFIRQQSQVYLVCQLRVCNGTNLSEKCSSHCTSGNRTRRSLKDDDKEVEVVQGPLIYRRGREVGEDENKRKFPLAAIIAVCIVAAILVVAGVVLVFRKMKRSHDVTSNGYSAYDSANEKIAMLPMDSV